MSDQLLFFDHSQFLSKVKKPSINIIKKFKKITLAFSLFKISFVLLFFVEVIFLSLGIIFLASSAFVALIIGLLFLSVFSYFVFLFYFQAKKPMQMAELRQSFVDFCRKMVALPKGEAEHHLSVAHAIIRLAGNLQEMEYNYFSKKNSFLQKFSCFLHHKDIFTMRESLLLLALEEHIEQIRNTPTDLEVHASLSSVYVTLAKLYKDEISGAIKKRHPYLEKKFLLCSKKSIEELKILGSFAPNDPWVHAQLAQVYHTLDQKEREAQEYETILKLSPNDLEVWFRLGKLYFQLNQAAEGLKIYDRLKKSSYKKADELLRFYEGVKIEDLADDSFEYMQS